MTTAIVGAPEVRIEDGACQARLSTGSDEEIVAAREALRAGNPGLDLQWVPRDVHREEPDGWTTIGMVWEEA